MPDCVAEGQVDIQLWRGVRTSKTQRLSLVEARENGLRRSCRDLETAHIFGRDYRDDVTPVSHPALMRVLG